MNILLTGAGGTVGPHVVRRLGRDGLVAIPWDRDAVPPDDRDACLRHLETLRPDAVVHLALGPEAWAAALAGYAADAGTPFLYTSTVSVFGGHQRGPHGIDATPEPPDDYGRYKRRCEEAILAVNPEAKVARIGWQIGCGEGGNQMMDHLIRTQRTHGHIDASTRWFQACSFLEDTADALVRVLASDRTGIVHVDGNPGLSFFELVTGLDRRFHMGWTIRPVDDPDLDNRLADPSLKVASVGGCFR